MHSCISKTVWQIVFFTCVTGNVELNTAVIPQWKDIIDSKMLSSYSQNSTINIQYIDCGKTRSDFDKVKRGVEVFKEHNTHIVIGPFDVPISLATEALNITYIATTEVTLANLNSTFQIVPKLDDFSEAILDMVIAYKWEHVSIFFDDDKGRAVIEKLLTNHELMIKSWRLDRETNEKQARDHLVHMRSVFMQRTIVVCRKINVKILFETARSLAMLSAPYEWFVYDPGDEIVDVIRNHADLYVNFTMFTLLPFNGSRQQELRHRNCFNLTLAHDAAKVLHEIGNSPFKETTHNAVKNEIRKRMFSIYMKGKTGVIQFDGTGARLNITILMTEVTGYSTQKIGEWHSNPGSYLKRLKMFEKKVDINVTQPFPLVGRTTKVVTILEKPFCMYKRDHKVRTGNDKFEGFAVDLIQEVATMLQFDYQLYVVHDGLFGVKMPDGSWNGMIGELIHGNATMSVGPLSINSEREAAVDFTKPFMTRYISVLMRIPHSETSYFEFLNPLHPTVWFCTIGAFIFVSIVLYIFERIGTVNQKECPSFRFKESFWFVFGCLLQGSTDSSPSTLPGRILTSSWWFFALILISSYTANLAAFLTVKKINTPIKTVTDLASQTKIKYGTVKDSGIMSFFKNTDIEHFSKMWAQMSEIEPSSLVSSTDEGFKKVKHENYAFFWDTTVNKYKTIENCEFMEVGPPFDPKGFGIGVPPGATYREELSMAILKLSDIGRLHELENRWWGRRNCPDFTKPSTDETSELQIDSVAGVFFVLIGGVAVAAVVCLAEYFAKQISNSVKKKALVRGSLVAVDILQTLGRQHGNDETCKNQH